MRHAALLAGLLLFVNAVIAASVPRGIITLDGQAAPALHLQDMDGEAFNLANARGRWAFVHFWASWCGPCRREMPAIARMQEQLGETSIEVVIVNTAETEDEVFNFLGIHAPSLRSLLDSDGQTTAQWQPRGLPSTYLVDPQGRLRYLALGGRPWDTEPYLKFLRELAR